MYLRLLNHAHLLLFAGPHTICKHAEINVCDLLQATPINLQIIIWAISYCESYQLVHWKCFTVYQYDVEKLTKPHPLTRNESCWLKALLAINWTDWSLWLTLLIFCKTFHTTWRWTNIQWPICKNVNCLVIDQLPVVLHDHYILFIKEMV